MTDQVPEKQSDRYKKIQEFSERRALLLAVVEVLKAKKNFLFLTLALALGGTLIGHYFQETTYTSSSTLFVQALEDPTAAAYLLNQQVGRTNKAERIETYMRFLVSDSFFMTAAQKLKYHDDFKQLKLLSPQSQSFLNVAAWTNKLKSFLGHPIPEATTTIKSTLDLVGLLKQYTTYDTDYSHFIHVKTTTLDPKTSQIIANVIAEEFVALTNQRGLQEIEQIKDFVNSKLKETEERIQANESALIEFKKKNNVISTGTSSSLLAERYTRLTSDVEALRMQLEENQKLISFFEKGQKDVTSAPEGNGKTKVFGAKETAMILHRKLEQLKKQKALVLAQDEGSSQDWRTSEIEKEIERTSKAFEVYAKKAGEKNLFLYMNPQKILQRVNELKEDSEVIRTKLSTHNKLQEQMQAQISAIPSLAQKQLVLENALQVDTENYTNLKNKLTELEIQKISQKKEIRVDQSAQMPGPSAKGNILLKLLFSTLVSILLGISIIVGIESIDPSIKHRSDLGDCGLEFIGEVPLMNFNQPKGLHKGFGASSQIISYDNPESIEAMSFKYIRARLESYRYKFKKDHLIISVSSGAVHDGKSLISANLATSLAQLNRSVLLIDCDLRRPSQNAYFDVNPPVGLVDLLNVTHNLDDVLIKNLRPNMDYIAAGFCHKQSTEYISSEKFRVLITVLKEQYDYIIIDTPPVFAAVDSSIIANLSDIPILIANFRDTKKYALSEAYNQILQISYKRVYGVINKAILSSARFHYYGYHNLQTRSEENTVDNIPTEKATPADLEQFMKNIKQKTS
jgi:polysaccharide biosynthesis transport protein